MIKPTKYPMNPDDLSDLFGEAVSQGRNGKQDILVSGDNIKTINGESLLGSGDLTVSGSGAAWGSITGTLSSQDDLQDALIAKQDTLVSGTNIKTINSQSLLGSGNIYINPKTISANGLNLTGTANQISASIRIAGGTLVANNTIHIRSICTKSAGTTGSQVRLYINTNNSLTGATQIATGATMSTTNYIQNFWRNFYFDGSSLYLYSTGNPLSTDLTQGPISYYSLNPANDYYLLFAVQNSTTTPDNLGHRKVIVQIYD